MALLFVGIIAFITAVGVIWVTRNVAYRRGFLDVPNERSSHRRPVPRLGGLGIVVGFATAVGIAALGGLLLQPNELAFVAAFVAVAALGLYDDLRPLRSAPRFLIQLALAVGYCAATGPLNRMDLPGFGTIALGPFAYPFSVLWITWMINLFNFMDGIDGIAATQGIVASMAFVIGGLRAHDPAVTTFAAILGCATLGFFVFNAPPASIFMGDAGSTALGFAFAALSITAARPAPTVLEFPAGVLAVGPFVFDATLTLVRRVIRRERFWQAHRSHLYQRPQRWGVSHFAVTASAGVLMCVSSASAIAYQEFRSASTRLAVVALVLCLDVAVAITVLRIDARAAES